MINKSKFFLCWLGLTLLLTASSVSAKTIPIGLTLDMSGADAQYSLDFKSGIDAYFHKANREKILGKYKLELVVMDDLSSKNRVKSNTKRLIKSKKVLALMTNHHNKLAKEIAEEALKEKTLLFSANHLDIALNKRNKKFIINYEQSVSKRLGQVINHFMEASELYILSDEEFNNTRLRVAMMAYENDSNDQAITQISSTQLRQTAPQQASVFLINKPYVEAINDIQYILSLPQSHQVYVLSNSGSKLIAKALPHSISAEQLTRVNYVSTTPLHDNQLSITNEFTRDMNNFNPDLNKSDQAFKGYVLASILTKGLEQSLEGLKADSLLGVVTLPFQILDKVVGWVKHTGADTNSVMVADNISRFTKLNIGLASSINLKNNVVVDDIWLVKANKDGKFVTPTENN